MFAQSQKNFIFKFKKKIVKTNAAIEKWTANVENEDSSDRPSERYFYAKRQKVSEEIMLSSKFPPENVLFCN